MDNPALHWLDGPLDSEPRQPINHVIDWSNRFNELPFDDIDTRIFAGVCTDWLNRLTMLRCAYPPDLFNPSEATLPSVDNIELFTQRLMALQRHDTAPAMKTGSWAIPRDAAMPSDARVEFVYFPTYIAIAWLCLIRQDYPDIAARLGGFDRTLSQGLRFASYRKLRGHGHEANEQCLDAVEILALGKTFSCVRADPSISRAFRNTIDDVETSITEKMPQDTGWSGTDPKRRQRALDLLLGADADDNQVCAPVHERWDEWQRRFLTRQIADASAARAKALLVPRLLESLKQAQTAFSEDFEAAKPRYTVFKQRPRLVYTSPRRFELAVELAPLVRQAGESTIANTKSGHSAVDYFKDEVFAKFLTLLPEALTQGLTTHTVFPDAEFSPVVVAVKVPSSERIDIDVKVSG